jgi:tetratricopeptide (TPR) repeat protein
MSASKKAGKRIGKSSRSTDANAVGYKRPPANTRFTKGKSGNPHGRAKGQRNVANLTKDLLNRLVRVRSGDEILEMRAIEAIFRVLANKAAQGNSRATSLVNKLREMAGFTNEITEEERQKRAMRLPRAFIGEEYHLVRAPAREKDRQRYLAMAESDEADSDVSGDSGSDDETIPPTIRAGDILAPQGKFDEALAAYRSQLALCKTELTADSSNKPAQYNFRRAVARIGLLANTLLLAGNFKQALKIADEAIAEAANGFWIAPEEPFRIPYANTGWFNLIGQPPIPCRGLVQPAQRSRWRSGNCRVRRS